MNIKNKQYMMIEKARGRIRIGHDVLFPSILCITLIHPIPAMLFQAMIWNYFFWHLPLGKLTPQILSGNQWMQLIIGYLIGFISWVLIELKRRG